MRCFAYSIATMWFAFGCAAQTLPGSAESREQKVTENDVVTNIEDHPWIVHLTGTKDRTEKTRWRCGGVLAEDGETIVTAAHCVDFEKRNIEVEVFAGTTVPTLSREGKSVPLQKRTFGSEDIRINPEYCHDGHRILGTDIAVVTLPTAFDISGARVRPIPLADESLVHHLEASTVGSPVVVAGWGYDERKQLAVRLRSGALKIVPASAAEGSSILSQYSIVGDSSILFTEDRDGGNTGFCDGDSGGPLINDGPSPFLMGIANLANGKSKTSEKWKVQGCGALGVFTRIHSYRDWINRIRTGEQLGVHSCSSP